MAKRVTALTIFFLAAFCAVAQQKTSSGGSADEKAIRAEAAGWFKTGAAKNAEGFSSYYAPDANLLPPGGAMVSGKEKIRAFWLDFFKKPCFAITGGPTSIEVAKSGDYAYERGAFRLTLNDASGKPATSVGKYVVVWKKQPDGKWKAIADIFNSDQ